MCVLCVSVFFYCWVIWGGGEGVTVAVVVDFGVAVGDAIIVEW